MNTQKAIAKEKNHLEIIKKIFRGHWFGGGVKMVGVLIGL